MYFLVKLCGYFGSLSTDHFIGPLLITIKVTKEFFFTSIDVQFYRTEFCTSMSVTVCNNNPLHIQE